MREIKFRAWDKEEKVMYHDTDAIRWNLNRDVVVTEHVQSEIETIKLRNPIVMQYTGLKDKNGKEIYEGDILKGSHGPISVEWIECDACFEFSDENDWREFTKNELAQMKVIGNIYENPDLLLTPYIKT